MTAAEYEATRPAGEQKLVLDNVVVRVYEKNGEVNVIVNKRDAEGNECLPLGYMLGSTALKTRFWWR
jgi:hypothetical protein